MKKNVWKSVILKGGKKNAAGGDLISACGVGHLRVWGLQSPHAAFFFLLYADGFVVLDVYALSNGFSCKFASFEVVPCVLEVVVVLEVS